jgi:hypothetical protein
LGGRSHPGKQLLTNGADDRRPAFPDQGMQLRSTGMRSRSQAAERKRPH